MCCEMESDPGVETVRHFVVLDSLPVFCVRVCPDLTLELQQTLPIQLVSCIHAKESPKRKTFY